MKTLLIFLLTLTWANLYSQADSPGGVTQTRMTESAKQLFNLQKQAKLNNDITKVMELQKEIDKQIGTVTKPATQEDGHVVAINPEVISTDNININTLVLSADVKGLATCTEARGTTTGRIWMAVAYGGTGTAGDTLSIFKSDDGGITFTLALKVGYNANVSFKNDQLDMEIVEAATGTKNLWIVRGMSNATDQYIGATIMNTTTNTAANPIVAWPGNNANTHYYNPRICSDNEIYATNPYVFITAALDSVAGTDHNLKVKFAQCNNPYDANPTITYNPVSIASSTTRPFLPHFNQDIAFYDNGSDDSLIVAINNRTDSTSITMRTFNVGAGLTSVIATAFNFQPGPSNQTMFPRLATSGGNTVALSYRTNVINNGDWDLRSYITTGGISVQANWISRIIDNTTNTVDVPGRCDIIGVKLGEGSFRASYGISAATGMLKYSNYLPGGTNWQTPITILPSGASTGTVPPVAGFRHVNGDSCLLGYAGFNGLNAYSVAGSSGTVIGINPVSNTVPEKYELSQNYPNPFNPETSIKFSVPETGFVSLQVFDISGRVIATLVNENVKAGTYSLAFNGAELSSGAYFYRLTTSAFTETKKMLLVK